MNNLGTPAYKMYAVNVFKFVFHGKSLSVDNEGFSIKQKQTTFSQLSYKHDKIRLLTSRKVFLFYKVWDIVEYPKQTCP